jgi:hypothetical protein
MLSQGYTMKKLATTALGLMMALSTSTTHAAEYLNGIKWTPPAIVTPGQTDAQPPSDAIILFDGTSLSGWKNGENWSVKDGVAYSGKGKITTLDRMEGTRTSKGKWPGTRKQWRFPDGSI